MAAHFLHLATTPSVVSAQKRYVGRSPQTDVASSADQLGPEEREFIESRDSFYMGTVTENAWPYVQHRGGPPGFLRVLPGNQVGFADVRGNQQLLSTGNLMANDRVALFLMDYPQRSRLKILGHAQVVAASDQPELANQLATKATGLPERLFLIDVVAYDWNCPKYITPRYTREEVQRVIAPLQSRIAELESALTALKIKGGHTS